MTKLPGAIAGARIVAERFVRQQNPEGRMPLTDHIRELRDRVVKMALVLAAGMTAGFVFFSQAWHVIERPLCSATIRGHSGCRTLGVNQLVLNGPLDAFYLRVKVAVIVGVILSSPRCTSSSQALGRLEKGASSPVGAGPAHCPGGLPCRHQNRIPHRCERRSVREVQGGHLFDRHPVP
jgi:hypothetical protein